MKEGTSAGLRFVACLSSLLLVRPAVGADTAADGKPDLEKELTRLKTEVREQRALLEKLIQAEQRRYDLLLKVLQAVSQLGQPSDRVAASAPAATPSAGTPPTERGPSSPQPAAAAARAPGDRHGAIAGTVQVRGTAAGPVFVYVEDVPARPVRGRTVEIRQEGKEFHPRVTAVQRGTTVLFPNSDRLTHNVFSLSPQQPFDLGMTPAGEKGHPIRLAQTGVLDVRCNIHGRMWAQVLVVPNALYAKVGSDGRFRLPHVPAGERTVVAWTAHSEPVRQRVVVSGQGAEASFVLEASPVPVHNKRNGQPYPSYQE